MENMNYKREQFTGQSAAGRVETKPKETSRINLKDFLMLLLMNWFWFVICGGIAFVLSYIYVKTIQPQYQRVADLQIKFANADKLDMQSYLGIQDLGVTNMSNELYILGSLKLAGEVSEKIHMDVQYYKQGTFRNIYLFQDRPFEVSFQDDFRHPVEIKICPISVDEFQIVGMSIGGVEQQFDTEKRYKFYHPKSNVSQEMTPADSTKNVAADSAKVEAGAKPLVAEAKPAKDKTAKSKSENDKAKSVDTDKKTAASGKKSSALEPAETQAADSAKVASDSLRVDPEIDATEKYICHLPVTNERILVTVTEDHYHDLIQNHEQEICVLRMSPEVAAERCQSMVMAEQRATSMVRITCTANSVEQADEILYAYIDVYNAQTLEEKNAVTISSFKFVEERVKETAKELGETESKLIDHGIDPDMKEAQATSAASNLIASRLQAQEQVSLLRGSLQDAKNTRDMVRQAIAQKEPIPEIVGEKAGRQVDVYNDMIQKRNRLVANSSIDNPAVHKIDENLKSLELAVSSAMESYVAGIQAKLNVAEASSSRYSNASQVNRRTSYDSTSIETKSLSIMRDYKQSYFSFLLKKREELRLQLAVSEADTRLIENPMGSSWPIYPVPYKIYIKFVAGGLALPAIIMLLSVLFNSTIRGR